LKDVQTALETSTEEDWASDGVNWNAVVESTLPVEDVAKPGVEQDGLAAEHLVDSDGR
jgi:hypothetical protein